ncbi:disintegrin and metalloproteinase domain-containing protein 18-like [Accipiter gentilis]|uniref:disintegrin and metalloproteinase domain-containing protein 18-like n=1 Tax=Astur gentilis TaxID=8957 RepID=UPI00210FD35A|nr:disintegrin and metalloproteinase domain-containing protein 18-like [Accipiter gentilis]
MPVLYKALSSASAFRGGAGRGRTGAAGPLPAGQMGPRRALLPLLLLLLRSQALAQITVPLRLPANATGEAALRQARCSRGPRDGVAEEIVVSSCRGGRDAVSYVLRIEGRPYTIHLQQHVFLSEDFRIYMSDEKGSLRFDLTPIKGGCHYRGYVEGFPSSAVTLSTCSGLRGLLQFENVSYGIEPLGYSPAFEHFVYRVSDERTAGSLLANSHPESGPGRLTAEMSTKARGGDEPLSASARSPKFLKMYVVLDKALYNYMGSDTNAATQKIIQVFNLINNMFNPLNVTIVLSSLELWTEQNKISTAGEADDLLQRFLQWKQSHLTLGSYDIAYLLL